MGQRLTQFILVAFALGILAGFALNHGFAADDPALARWADYLKLLPDVFLRLIKMIIAPLVFGTIVSGIAGLGDARELGRIGGRAVPTAPRGCPSGSSRRSACGPGCSRRRRVRGGESPRGAGASCGGL